MVPAGGTMIWLDSMAIPRAASEPELAHAFIDYLLEPEVAAKNAEHVHYATPNRAALELLLARRCGRTKASIRRRPRSTAATGCTDRGPEIEKVEAVWREVRQ